MKKIIISLFAVSLAVRAHADTYTFIGGNSNDAWSDPANWSDGSGGAGPALATDWSGLDTAFIPAGKTAFYNAVLGDGTTAGAPTVVIETGGTLRWPGNGPGNFYNPVTLAGGVFDIRQTYSNVYGNFDVVEDSAISFNLGNNPVWIWGSFTASNKTLTFDGVNSGAALTWGCTVQIRAASPNFYGLVDVVVGRVAVDAANAFPNATVRVGAGGFYDISQPQNNPLILDGGALRASNSNVYYYGPITLLKDSYMDTTNWTNQTRHCRQRHAHLRIRRRRR